MNKDLDGLKRLIKLPAEPRAATWQTGQAAAAGGDWWLAAILDISPDQRPLFLAGAPDQTLFETPTGLRLEAEFAALKALPGAELTAQRRLRVVTDTWGVGPYAKSPLLDGKVIQLGADRVLLLLGTR